MSLARVKSFLGIAGSTPKAEVAAINLRREELSVRSDHQLRTAIMACRGKPDVVEVFALTAVIAERVLGLRMFDVQLSGALALERGDIAEMQTGEGKTLAAVPAIVWYALHGRGVHVLTANDYLAKRDAEWMCGIYCFFGLSIGHLAQGMSAEERRAAYSCDVTYATANEVGFDCLRDGLARRTDEQVQRPFTFAVIDEVDSILIDEARIPLVIAGGVRHDLGLAERVDGVVARLRPPFDFIPDEYRRNVRLTDLGASRVERELGCENLYEAEHLGVLTAVQDALHAHVLLKLDVDYVIKDGAIELVDEWKGRIAQNRRWPAGLHAAIEAKEHVRPKDQGRILGSITVQNLVGLYGRICGMTGTAATQAREFWEIYKLPVTVIPTHRPVIRKDLPDAVFATKRDRDRAVLEEIRKVHRTRRPMLVGTGSVEDSERLSAQLTGIGVQHSVLNARHDAQEAQIIAQAGALGAVTISTNMAGRGTDILLGGDPPAERERVVELGGLYVIGMARHEARRIDHQLRGRAGRQGDPGTSRFFLSLQDDLLVRFGIAENPDIDSVQRTVESQNLEIRQTLWKYESVSEHQRRETGDLRRRILLRSGWSIAGMVPEERFSELAKDVGQEALEQAGQRLALAVLDDLWADYLANVAELKGGIHWVSWGGRDPLFEFLTRVKEIYAEMKERFAEEVADAFDEAEIYEGTICFPNEEIFERGATWTYLTTDQPFGLLGERILRGIRRKMRSNRVSSFIRYSR